MTTGDCERSLKRRTDGSADTRRLFTCPSVLMSCAVRPSAISAVPASVDAARSGNTAIDVCADAAGGVRDASIAISTPMTATVIAASAAAVQVFHADVVGRDASRWWSRSACSISAALANRTRGSGDNARSTMRASGFAVREAASSRLVRFPAAWAAFSFSMDSACTGYLPVSR